MTRHAALSEPVLPDAMPEVVAFRLEAPAAVAEEWRGFEPAAIGHVFATHDFVMPWLHHVAPAEGVAPRIVTARDREGRLLALLPFGMRRHLGARTLTWLGGDQADYPGGLFEPRLLAGLARHPERRKRFVAAAIAAAGPADAFLFERQVGDLEGLPNPFAGGRVQLNPSGAYQTRLGGDWDAYYSGKRAKSSRHTDKRKLKKLEGLGKVRVSFASEPEEIARILPVLYEQKRLGLAERGVGDLFATEPVRSFYAAVAEKPYPQGPSHVAALYCGDAIVACNWGLVRGGRYYYVMHAYADGDIARASPGRFLMYHLMQWSIARRVELFDFTVGNEPYKEQWCEEIRPLYVAAAPLTPQGLPASLADSGTLAVKRFIKTNPRLWDAAQKVRRRLGGGAAPAAAGAEPAEA
jgi:CelD/BcsL family acetyltransferase involved in cellulose biosynthesis